MEIKIQHKLLLISALIFLFSIVGVSAGTPTAVDPNTNYNITGNFYFNSTYQLNSTNSNVTRADFFLDRSGTITLLGSNQTVNVSLNDSGFGTIVIRNNTAGITDCVDCRVLVNFTVTTPSANNDTLVITGVDIDNNAPTATITTPTTFLKKLGRFQPDCGQSTDGVDTALTVNISAYQSNGVHYDSKTSQHVATGVAGSARITFTGTELNLPIGFAIFNCIATDNVGLSDTSSNITVQVQSSEDDEIVTADESAVKVESDKTDVFIIGIITIFVILVVVAVVIVLMGSGRAKKRRR